MRRAFILSILFAQNALAQGASPGGVEADFFRSIVGVSISLGLLVLLVSASYLFLINLRKEAKQEAKDDRTAKDNVFQQIPQLAREMTSAFERATQAAKDSDKEQVTMHQQNAAAIRELKATVDALVQRFDSYLLRSAK